MPVAIVVFKNDENDIKRIKDTLTVMDSYHEKMVA